MEKNIYDVLNEVEIDLEEYEVKEFTPLEERKILNKFFKKATKTVNYYKKYMVAASVAVVSLGAIGTLPTLATMDPTLYRIANILGLEKDLEDYTTVLSKPVTEEGITIGIGEVAYDKENHRLIVTTYTSSQEIVNVSEEDRVYDLHERVYINGKELNTSSRAESIKVDEYTVATAVSYDIKEELTGKLDIKICIPQIFIGEKEYRNNWSFEFTVDGERLAKDTKVIPIGEQVELPNGEVFTLVKYTDNVIGKSIYYQSTDELNEYLLEVRGEDNLGNPVKFRIVRGNTGQGGEFRMVNDESVLSSQATSLEVRVYTGEGIEKQGEIITEYHPVSEKITIPLN